MFIFSFLVVIIISLWLFKRNEKKNEEHKWNMHDEEGNANAAIETCGHNENDSHIHNAQVNHIAHNPCTFFCCHVHLECGSTGRQTIMPLMKVWMYLLRWLAVSFALTLVPFIYPSPPADVSLESANILLKRLCCNLNSWYIKLFVCSVVVVFLVYTVRYHRSFLIFISNSLSS